MPTTVASKPRTGIYPTPGGGFLLVPTEDMWSVHEASKPSAILARAGLGKVDWYQWLRRFGPGRPWLQDWLYGGPLPADAGDFRPTTAMLAYRREGTTRAILAAASTATDRSRAAWRKDRRADIQESLLSYWRRLYRAYDWFDPWLLRGSEPGPGVMVATVNQVRRCARAWDFSAFCRRIEVRSDSTYVLWLSNGQIPHLGWLKWLYGAPAPAGAFVVTAELQRLRHQMGQKAILRAAGLDEASTWRWQKNPLTSGLIKPILAGEDVGHTEAWRQLPQSTRERMEAVRREASPEACCSRARVSVAQYYVARREARHCGVEGDLLNYLRCTSPYGTEKSRLSGLVADNFFIPTGVMLRFRDAATREGASQKVWSLQSLPGFDLWFLDWATPKAHKGRRHLVPPDATPPSASARNGHNVAARKGHTFTEPVVAAHGKDQSQPKRPRPGGRERSEETKAVYRFCYDHLGKMKRRSIMGRAKIEYGARAPKEPSHVSLFAKRYAKAEGLPFPPNR